MKQIRKYCLGESGATAVEFGLVFPVLIMLMFGIFSLSLLGGAVSGMHYAVEEAARCFAVNKTTCGTSSDAATYAHAHYLGPKVNPVFEATNTGCGFTVSGTATFVLQFAMVDMNIPLSASACYPGKVVAA